MRKKFFLKNLAFFLIPLLIPFMIFGSLSIILTQSYVKNNINKNNISLLKQTKENVELVLNELDQLNLVFDVNSEISTSMDSILDNTEFTYESNIISNVINNFLSADQNARPYIQSIYIYYDNFGDSFYSTTNGKTNLAGYYDSSWYQSYLNQDSHKMLWTEEREFKEYAFENKTTKIISIYRRMLSRKGVIVLNILPQYINSILRSNVPLPEQNLFIMNENKQILFSNTDNDYLEYTPFDRINKSNSDFFTIKIANQNYIVSQLQSQRYGWTYISIISQRSLYRLPSELAKLMLMLLFAAFIIGLVLTYYITNKNYKQVSNIINILDSAESGKPLPPLPERIKDEYSYIVNNILKTFVEQSFLKVTLSEKKYRMQVMELIALQSQINHHFLFNTMKTIYWKSFALTDGPNVVCEMIENLSDILSYSLESIYKTVTLESELKSTQSYIDIQKVRYKDKFDVKWEYDNNILECRVIKLLLQPLIENSIYHGLIEKTGRGGIKVRIQLSDSHIIIAVIDNGIGLNAVALQELRQKLMSDGDYSQHIGLFNINKRLKLMYGEEYGIKIRSSSNLGTVVYINIPKVDTNSEDNSC